MQKYSQLKAMLAIVKASLLGQLRSPMSLVFGFIFPFIFILIFGTSGPGMPGVRVAFAPGTDTTSALYKSITAVKTIILSRDTGEVLQQQLLKGRVTAVLSIRNSAGKSTIEVASSSAGADRINLLDATLTKIIATLDKWQFPNRPTVATINVLQPTTGRIYRDIDFVLPGQLGFSILAAGLFGVAFLFFNLRETLVLKRLSATPINRLNIILGETLARVIFQLIIISIIILIGHFGFKFTLVNGWITVLELLLLSFFGLLVFMGFGFFVSGFAKSINTIPAFTNLLGFPQFMLAGTFFPVNNLPNWLQVISKILPLTYLNNAMRKVAFEGVHLTGCLTELGALAIWGVIIYFAAIKLFKWE